MQTKQTTGSGMRASDYVTIVQQACNEVSGFEQLYKEMERAVCISGKSNSTLINYGRQLAHLGLHYKCFPLNLNKDQVMDYLFLVKSRGTASATFFKFTVYGMRYACKLRGLEYRQFSLPEIEKPDKLPVVLSQQEVKRLLGVCTLLKHRILLGLTYGCGLRCAEVRNLKIADVDLDRGMVHVLAKAKAVKIVACRLVPCLYEAFKHTWLTNVPANGFLRVLAALFSLSVVPNGWWNRR